MRQSVKYMYAIKSGWLSFDTVASFKPFVTTLILKEKLEKSFDKQISELFMREYGFSLPYFILTNIIKSYMSGGYVNNHHSFLYFNLEMMQSLPKVLTQEFTTFNIEYDNLIRDFMTYCNSKDVNFMVAEQTIISFVKEYDAQVMTNDFKVKETPDMDVERYFFYTYLKEMKEKNSIYYDFILKLCQGNIIKSFMFNEGIEKYVSKDLKLYLDTPVLLRILGYYGEFYENEYKNLLKLWEKQDVQIYVFSHNYDEVVHLLERCSKAIDDLHFHHDKVDDITLYFKQEGLSHHDVDEMIVTLPKKFESLNIEIVDIKLTDFEDVHIESEKEINDGINDTFLLSKKYDNELINSPGLQKMIEIDVKSVMYSYALREKNNIKSFKDCKLFFVTRNSGLITSVLDYNNKYYPDTISPVIRDTLIGMIACWNDMKKIKKLVEMKTISYCYTAYKPSRLVLEKFTNQIESMKNENQLSDEQYLILKHNKTVIPHLVQLTNDSYSNIDYDTIHEVLVKVEEDMLYPLKKHYDEDLENERKEKLMIIQKSDKTQKELEDITKESSKNKEMHKESENKRLRLVDKLMKERDSKLNKSSKSIYIIVKSVVASLGGLVISANIVVYLKNPQFTVWNIIIFLFSVASIVWGLIILLSKKGTLKIPFVKHCLDKKASKIVKEYDDLMNFDDK